MRNQILYITGIVLTIICLSSCNPPKYIPNVVNTPMLSNMGEIQASGHFAVSGFDLQLAAAVTDNIGLMVNGNFYNEEPNTIDDSYHKHRFVEFGAGYYTKLGKIGRFDTFGGYGYGKIQDSGFSNLESDEVSNTRYFFQPSIGMTTKIFDANAAWRCTVVNLYQGSEHYGGVFIEPVVTFKLGYEPVKSKFQLGFSIPFSEESLDFNYQPIIFSFGFQINIGRIWD